MRAIIYTSVIWLLAILAVAVWNNSEPPQEPETQEVEPVETPTPIVTLTPCEDLWSKMDVVQPAIKSEADKTAFEGLTGENWDEYVQKVNLACPR